MKNLPSFWKFIFNKMWWWGLLFLFYILFRLPINSGVTRLDLNLSAIGGMLIILICVFIFWSFKYKKIKRDKGSMRK